MPVFSNSNSTFVPPPAAPTLPSTTPTTPTTQNVASNSLDMSFFPSAKIRLLLRFDEFGSTELQSSAPLKPLNVARGNVVARNPLVANIDNSTPGVTRYVLTEGGQSSAAGGPQAQTGSSDNLTFPVVGVIPKKATWNQNGIRSADTLTGKIRYIDCPIDPRILRAIGIEYYLGTVTADEYSKGIAGQTRTGTISSGMTHLEPLNIVPDNWIDQRGNQRTNLRFQGFVDKWRINWEDEEEPSIEFEARDNTQIVIDTEAPPGIAIATDKPLDLAIANYLSNFPNFVGLSVEYLPAGTTAPVLGQALAGTAFQPTLGPVPSQGGGAANKLSVWDYLTDVCGALGHNIRVDGTRILIQQVVTLLSSASPRRTDDPFAGRTVDGVQFSYRRFIWGRNLRKYVLARNYSKHQPKGIEVRCYSPRRKKDLVVRYPDVLSQTVHLQVKPRPGDGVTDQSWLVWKVKGIEDLPTLMTVAQNVYQSMCRMELELELETKNLSSFGAANLDPDILDMRTGDTFEELVRDDAEDAFIGTIEQTAASVKKRATEFLQKLGFSQDLANAAGNAYSKQGLQTTFRLRTMSIDWNPDSDGEDGGVSISIHGVNYIEVRADPLKWTAPSSGT
jgi:hypothetical protein